jgi:hypothetical protein
VPRHADKSATSMFTHHFGQKKYEFVTKTSENVQLVAKKNGNCQNKTYTFYNFFQSVKASYGWLQKKKRELSEKVLSDFIKLLYSLFFNQRTTTPQFTPKTELTTFYTFDLG